MANGVNEINGENWAITGNYITQVVTYCFTPRVVVSERSEDIYTTYFIPKSYAFYNISGYLSCVVSFTALRNDSFREWKR